MTTSLVLTFISHDKPGLVSLISERIAAAGGSWLESRLARLGEEFAGIVLIGVPEENEALLTAGLRALEDAGLRITITRSGGMQGAWTRSVELNLVGQDRPGIVRDVTQALSALGANIEEFSSGIESAAFTGEAMFRAVARLGLPDGVTGEVLRAALERLADEIMVDVVENGVP